MSDNQLYNWKMHATYFLVLRNSVRIIGQNKVTGMNTVPLIFHRNLDNFHSSTRVMSVPHFIKKTFNCSPPHPQCSRRKTVVRSACCRASPAASGSLTCSTCSIWRPCWRGPASVAWCDQHNLYPVKHSTWHIEWLSGPCLLKWIKFNTVMDK